MQSLCIKGSDRINLFYGMSSTDNPVERCVTISKYDKSLNNPNEAELITSMIDSTVNFFWTDTTDGHNVNFIGKRGQSHDDGPTAEVFYEECITAPGTILPTGQNITNTKTSPNYEHTFNETGTYYFYCGINYNFTLPNGDIGHGSHCKNGGVKALVYVVGDPSECHFPSHPKCGTNVDFILPPNV